MRKILVLSFIFLLLGCAPCYESFKQVEGKYWDCSKVGPKRNSEGKTYWLFLCPGDVDVTIVFREGEFCQTHHLRL